ncbi:AI-2E family transporter [Cytophagaceae bacterium ABcell3]|nr:AI-2E family transporter [Cytophagaceae bacterium ABcell3]
MENDIKTIKNILTALLGFLFIYLLNVFSTLVIPLLLALFMAMLLQPALAWFEKKNWPYGLSLSVISLGSLTCLALIGLVIYQTGIEMMSEKAHLSLQIRESLTDILTWANNKFNLTIEHKDAINYVYQYFSLSSFLKSTGVILGNVTNLLFMTSLYLIVFMGGILKYEQFIRYLEEGGPQTGKILSGFEEVKNSIATYMKVKVAVSLLTGLGYGFVCWVFGLDFYFFWGFLAFVLNFIPTFGSIIATIPPLLLSVVQLDPLSIMFLSTCLLTIQMSFGNILEPRLLGSSLSLNTITVLAGLMFWGYLWGAIGMILSVPLLVLMKVVLAQFPDARIIVKLMGSTNLSKNDDRKVFDEVKEFVDGEPVSEG